MLEDFKKFALKGNVIDLAVGVVIGGAFGKIVTSLVNDIITPIVSLLLGTVSFTDLHYKDIKYGNFIQSALDFFIIAFSIFMFIRIISKLSLKKKKEEVVVEAPPAPTTEELLKDIRDLLKDKQA
ncbi:large conductance mechanosensitive channel protein MscL [Viridibacillus arvi]|uniref:large conductance mechanosensitive channel protein MscL n=1 Tax=Viridibacillus arvi TaxID=263475 RepID=UPI00187B8736|nr:large conductance mechanosensitive channel protein MscL [Viridibacillus sp. JNUCC-6]QOV11910.1 large conductance mechanosensitive channel protein MscL [Viridibacillus sp. JNUCC-6]